MWSGVETVRVHSASVTIVKLKMPCSSFNHGSCQWFYSVLLEVAVIYTAFLPGSFLRKCFYCSLGGILKSSRWSFPLESLRQILDWPRDLANFRFYSCSFLFSEWWFCRFGCILFSNRLRKHLVTLRTKFCVQIFFYRPLSCRPTAEFVFNLCCILKDWL